MAHSKQTPSPSSGPRPGLTFGRPECARRPFKRGDLALQLCAPSSPIHGAIVVVCRSEEVSSALALPVRNLLGASAETPAMNLCLLAGVDTQEFGPGFHDLLKFIDDVRRSGA
jgi:hypothetical protein